MSRRNRWYGGCSVSTGRVVANDPVLAVGAQAALGRDHDLVAARAKLRLQRAAEQPLGRAEAVCLGRVEEVHAELERMPDRVDRAALVEAAPVASELPCPEADRRHFQLGHPESYRFHRRRLLPVAEAPDALLLGRVGKLLLPLAETADALLL